MSLRRLAVRGAVFTVFGYGASQVLRFSANLLLTRWLVPEYFGVMSLVNISIIGLQFLLDLGIETNIVRHPRGDDPAFLNTAWSIQVVRGCLLFGLSLALAWPLASLYGEDRLRWLLPLVGASALIYGVAPTSLIGLKRRLAIAQITALELTAQVIGLGVMLLFAWLSPSVYALAVGYFVTPIVRLTWGLWLSRGWVNRWVWDRAVVNGFFAFGRWLWLSTLLTFFAAQADRLLLGKIFSLELLGVYTIAFTLADMPRQLALAISSNVIFPTASRLVALPRDTLRDVILKNRWPVLVAMAGGIAVLATWGDLIIGVLYDRRYAVAGWMFPLLALGIWPNTLTQTVDAVFFALGKPRYVALGSLARLCFTVVGIPLGFHFGGVFGAVLVVALNDVPFYGPIGYGLYREGLGVLNQDIKASLVFLGWLVFFLLVRQTLGYGLPFEIF